MIGIVTTWNARCGIATYSSYLGEELKKHGEDVVILAERKDVLPEGVDPEFETYGIPSFECWSRKENFDNLLSIVKKENIDVVHLQHQFGLFPNEDNLRNLLSSLNDMGKKVIVTLHDVISYNFSAVSYFQPLTEIPDKIIVHNDACKRLLISDWKCPEDKIVKIWHGTKIVDIPDKETARKFLKIPPDAKVILSWGFLWESKGVLPLVEVFGQVKKTYPNSMFIHAGGLHPVFKDNSYIKKLFITAMKLGIKPEEFRVTGFVPERIVPFYFSVADIIVLNYYRGSISASGAAHRALASHKPLVGTDDPCIDEVPRLVVYRGDPMGLLQGVLKVLNSPELQKELVSKADKFAEESSWANVALEHLKVYI